MQQEGKKTKVNMGAGVLFGITNACAYPESFVRGGPTLTKFFQFMREGGYSRPSSARQRKPMMAKH